MQDPATSLARLMDYVKPGSKSQELVSSAWEPPPFEHYEDIRLWLKESVMSAHLYERFPDGRWTMELMLKEQNPGTYRYLVL